MAVSALPQSIEWMGIRLRVPDDWQVVRHGLAPEAGTLTLVDRRRQRLELTWLTCKNRPDLGRLIRDYQEQARVESGTEGASAESTELRSFGRGWRGFFQPLSTSGEQGARTLCRAVRFDERTSRLIELSISIDRSTAHDGHLLAQLFQSVHVLAAGGDCRRWQAFDLDVTTPPRCRLVKTRVNPADVQLSFCTTDSAPGKPTAREACLRRLGMARAWYSGNLRALVERHADGAVFTQWREQSHQGCPALLAEGTEAGPRYRRLFGKLRQRRVLVWHCPAENAIYQLTTTSPPGAPLLPQDFEVRFGTRATGEAARLEEASA